LQGNKKALTLEKEIFMSRLILATATIAIIGSFTLGTPNSYACQNQASVSAQTDAYLPVDTTYDPCDYYVNWQFQATRNYDDNGQVNVVFQILNGSSPIVTDIYESAFINHGVTTTHTGQKWVGNSASNTLKIYRAGSGSVKFYNISASVWYDNGNPTRPSGH
jgi:hypothetical protein